MIPSDRESNDYLRKTFTFVPDVEVEITTGPKIYRGKYRFDLYITEKYLDEFEYQPDLEAHTISAERAGQTFTSNFPRINEFSEALASFKDVMDRNPDKKVAFVLVHGDTDPLNGRWKLDADRPLTYADPVIFQIADRAGEANYSSVFLAACNPGGIKVDMQDVPIPVFATIGDNTVFGCPLAVYSPAK